jgi:branched-chain amino acid transport system permease protein
MPALDLLANGLIYGCFYALMAVGLAMIFGVLEGRELAHGEFFHDRRVHLRAGHFARGPAVAGAAGAAIAGPCLMSWLSGC